MLRAPIAIYLLLVACATSRGQLATPHAVVVISANAEWRVVKKVFPDALLQRTPWGEAFERTVDAGGGRRLPVVFLHGGWGKIAAAGSAQYAIDRWHPRYLINLGTCGGFAGSIDRHAVVLVDRTIVYDIREAMGDSAEAIASYATTIDLTWLRGEPPAAVRRSLLVSADRDLVPAELADLRARYGAIAGDWESGAIAYAAARNGQRVLILRGVSDLVDDEGGEALGNMSA